MTLVDDGQSLQATAGAPARPVWRRGVARLASWIDTPWLKAVLREPLTHFVIAGVAIFLISEVIEHQSDRYRIVFGPAEAARVAATYQQQYGAAPNADQKATLAANYIREEILYREALALGLDEGDEIVRRRLAQKYEFLQQDLAGLEEPHRQVLTAYYAENAARYTDPPSRTLSHLYFSPDRGGSEAARTKAREALTALNDGAGTVGGDSFAGPLELSDLDKAGAERLFGASQLSNAIFDARADSQWTGPFQCGYGWHLIRVTGETAGRQKPFDEVRDQVRSDWLADQRSAANTDNYQAVARRYTISREDAP